MLRSIALTFAVALVGSFLGGVFGVATAVYLELTAHGSWADYSTGEPPSTPSTRTGPSSRRSD